MKKFFSQKYNFLKIQKQLAKKVQLKNILKEIKTIAGFDQAFFKDWVISAAVVCEYKSLKVLEKTFVKVRTRFSYFPGFLFFREGPAIIKVWQKLKIKPDILLIDGQGILHPRRIGLASGVGVLLNQPTIGVAKNLLAGQIKNNKVYINGRWRGEKLQTKENTKPLFISPGHLVNFKLSKKVVQNCLRGHKLPEPLRLAHLLANEIKRRRG